MATTVKKKIVTLTNIANQAKSLLDVFKQNLKSPKPTAKTISSYLKQTIKDAPANINLLNTASKAVLAPNTQQVAQRQQLYKQNIEQPINKFIQKIQTPSPGTQKNAFKQVVKDAPANLGRAVSPLLRGASNLTLTNKNVPNFGQLDIRKQSDRKQLDDWARNIAIGVSGGMENRAIGRTPKIPPQTKEAPSLPGGQAPVKPQISAPQTPQDVASLRGSITQVTTNPKDPFYNLERLNIPNETKAALKEQIIGDVKPQIEKIVGSKLTNEEVIKRAVFTSDDLVNTIGRAKTEELASAQLALRQKIANMADSGNISKDLLESIKTDKSIATNNARLLQKRSISVDPKSPEGKLKVEMISNILKINDDLDTILKAGEKVNWDNPAETTKFYREFIKPSAGEWIDKLRYNSMLSSPTTHVVNTSSNLQGTGVLTPVQKTIEGTIDKFLSTVNPKRPRTRFTGEGAKYAEGYYSSVKEAYQSFLNVLSGKRQIENPDLRNIPLSTNPAARTVETALDIPSRTLEGMDQFFKTLTRGGLKKSYEYRLSKGAKMENLDAVAEKEASKLLFRGELVDKGEGVISHFLGSGASWVAQARHSPNPIFRWMAKMTFPFISTGTNLAKTGVEGNPVLGSINMIGNEDKIAGVSKLIMGGAVTLLGTVLANSERMTAWEPTDQKKRNAQRAAGILPWSIKVPTPEGETWIQYNKLHPLLGFQLGMVAAIQQSFKDGKMTDNTSEKIMNAVASTLKFTADQTYFKNLTDFSNFMNGDTEALPSLLSNYPSQFIPIRSFMGWITRIVDEYQRKPDTKSGVVQRTIQTIQSGIPGLSTNVPARLGPNGQPIKNSHNLLNSILPVKISKEDPNALPAVYDAQGSVTLYKKLKTMDKSMANDYLTSLPEGDTTYTTMKKFKDMENLGLGEAEFKMIGSGIKDGTRSDMIVSQVNKLKTKEEKNDYINKLDESGLIDDAVYEQLRSKLKPGSTTQPTPTPKKTSSIMDMIATPVKANAADITEYKAVANKVLPHIRTDNKDEARDNIARIATALKEQGIYSPEVLAYALATVEHETASTFRPIEEISGRSQAQRLGYSGGADYFGRGFIQLTHDYNYQKMGELLGLGNALIDDPSLALDPDISAKLLAVFFKVNGVADLAKRGAFIQARQPINPDNLGWQIARRARYFLSLLK